MPKVYDKDGLELTVGDHVRHGGCRMAITHIEPPGSGLVRITLSVGPYPKRTVWAEETMRGDFIHRDLQLIDQPNPHTKEAASAAPEGAEE